MQDLDMAVREHMQVGIFTASDLGEYHHQFLLITHYLISKNRMSTAEQSHSVKKKVTQKLLKTA